MVTEALSRSLPSDVAITATDINLAMIERGRARPGMERVLRRQADAMKLPFADAAFDLVVCQFGVMFFPDKRASFREIPAASWLPAGPTCSWCGTTTPS